MFPKLRRPSDTFRFAFFSDSNGVTTTAIPVNALVKSWDVDLILHGGDYNYAPVPHTVANFWSDTIMGTFRPEIEAGKFYVTLGNHDWDFSGVVFHNEILRQPGNGRYFKVTKANVTFYFIDYGCDSSETLVEPDGNTLYSLQAAWLKQSLLASTSTFNIGICHRSFIGDTTVHPDYPALNWPYREWGLDLLLTGHNHVYEEQNYKGFPIIVCGLGGSFNYPFLTSLSPYSRYRLTGLYGAMLFEVDRFNMTGKLIDTTGTVRRIFILNA